MFAAACVQACASSHPVRSEKSEDTTPWQGPGTGPPDSAKMSDGYLASVPSDSEKAEDSQRDVGAVENSQSPGSGSRPPTRPQVCAKHDAAVVVHPVVAAPTLAATPAPLLPLHFDVCVQLFLVEL